MGRIYAVNQLTKESLPNGPVKSYTYDGFGNRTSDGKFTYTWDTGDRLINITKKDESNPFTTYTYDDDNRRLSKTVNGVTTNYHYDGDSIDVLYETDGDGKVIRQYVYSDSGVRLAMKMNGKTLYYHYNAHGDVVALTDEASKMVAEYAYDAWGNVLKSKATTAEAKTNPYGYAGYTYDKEIEQYYLMARYYDPEQGVFTAIDPDPGEEDEPQTMNGYNYANSNPVRYIDPDGFFVQAILIGAAGGAVWSFAEYAWDHRKGAFSWKAAGKTVWKGAIWGGISGGTGKVFKIGYKAVSRTKFYKKASKKFIKKKKKKIKQKKSTKRKKSAKKKKSRKKKSGKRKRK